MKKQIVALAVPVVAGFFTAGCSSLQIVNDPDTFTPRHEEWYAAVHASYPGWRPDPLVQVQSAPLRPVITYSSPKKKDAVVPQDEPGTGTTEAGPDEPIPAPKDVETPVAPPEMVDKPVVPAAEKPALPPVEKPAVDPALVPASTYVVKNGDTLSGISLTAYGTTRHWQKIMQANPSIKDAKRLRYGMKITLPALPGRRAGAEPATGETGAVELPAVPAEPTDAAPVPETEPVPEPVSISAEVPVAKPAVPAPVAAPPPAATKPAVAVPAKVAVPAPAPAGQTI